MSLTVRIFDKKADLAPLNAWLSGHSIEDLGPSQLPKNGLMACMDDTRVAAGFLTSTDTDAAMIEYLVSDPLAPSEVRGRAISFLLAELVSQARGLGFKRLWCITKYDSILGRAIDLGGQVLETNLTLISRELN